MLYRDLHPEKTKPPGVPVVRTVLIAAGLVVVLGFVFPNVGSRLGDRKLREQVSQNQQILEALRMEVERCADKLAEYERLQRMAADFEVLQAQLKQVKGVNEATREDIADITRHIRQVDVAYQKYVANYRAQVRGSAAGTRMEKFTTLDGKVYEDVTVKSVDPLGMSITHRNGSRRIPYKELPAEMQELYQFNQDEALKKLKREALRRKQYELALAAAERARAERGGKREMIPDVRESAEREEAIKQLRQAIESINSKIVVTRVKMAQEEGKKLSRAPQYRQEIEMLNNARREYEARIRKLKDQGRDD